MVVTSSFSSLLDDGKQLPLYVPPPLFECGGWKKRQKEQGEVSSAEEANDEEEQQKRARMGSILILDSDEDGQLVEEALAGGFEGRERSAHGEVEEGMEEPQHKKARMNPIEISDDHEGEEKEESGLFYLAEAAFADQMEINSNQYGAEGHPPQFSSPPRKETEKDYMIFGEADSFGFL